MLEKQARLILIGSGLVLIVTGNSFELQILKIKVAELFAHVGVLLLIVGLLHWIFESTMRRQLIQEIYDAAIGAGRVSSSGIGDVQLSSRDVSYKGLIETSQRLVIGEHYSARLFEDYGPEIRARLSRGDETIVMLLDRECAAAEYLAASHSGHGAVAAQIAKIRDVTNVDRTTGKGKKAKLQVKWHQRVLRYSFVMNENLVWIRFYTNSEGYSPVPAICVMKGTALFEFFQNDVARLLEQSKDGTD
jgi:hypothetical protein